MTKLSAQIPIFVVIALIVLIPISPAVNAAAIKPIIQQGTTKVLNTIVTLSFLKHEDSKFGITIDYPSNWTVVKPSLESLVTAYEGVESPKEAKLLKLPTAKLSELNLQPIVVFQSPLENNYDTVRENLLLMVANLSIIPPISLNKVDLGIKDLSNVFPGFNLTQHPKPMTVDGNPAIRFAFTSGFSGNELMATHTYIIKHDRLYNIVFASEVESSSVYLPIFERMLESLKISR